MRELTPELRALDELARAASQGPGGVHALADRICATVAETFGFERVVIFRVTAPGDRLLPLAARGLPVGEVPHLRISDRPVFARACQAAESVFKADAGASGTLTERVGADDGVRSLLVVPLTAGGRCLGVLAADGGGEPFEVEPATLDVLTTIGALSGVFLERALELGELRRMNDVAQDFIGLASHELRAPAAVVHGIAATVELRGEQLSEAQRRDLTRTLYEQSDRLLVLVDQLLDLSRLEAKAIVISPRRFPVRRRVEEILLIVAAERRGEVEVDIDPSLEAFADPDAFERVVSNLVTNAFRYGRPPVAVGAEQTDHEFRLRVADRGPGVPPAFVPRLFERFSRSDPSGASAVGSGLGLSIAQSYAEAQGGEVRYRNAEPHGACFELVLPVSAQAG